MIKVIKKQILALMAEGLTKKQAYIATKEQDMKKCTPMKDKTRSGKTAKMKPAGYGKNKPVKKATKGMK